MKTKDEIYQRLTKDLAKYPIYTNESSNYSDRFEVYLNNLLDVFIDIRDKLDLDFIKQIINTKQKDPYDKSNNDGAQC